MLLGDWLRMAAPGGALLGLLAGGVLMSAIGMCYAELAARMPRAGGEFRYALEALGPATAFVVGWFLTLFMVAISAFEGTALAWLSALLGQPRTGIGTLYRVLGEPVTGYGLSVGIAGIVAICGINLAGLRVSVLFQRSITYSFLAVMVGLIVAGFVFGDVKHLEPWFSPPDGHSWVRGFAWIFATCAMLLYGFQSVLYVIDERAPGVSVRAATGSMVVGIVGAAIFYAAVVLSAGSLMPWQNILKAELPSVAAFGSLRAGGALTQLILIVAIFSLAKTWNAVVMMASRLILAQAQAGVLPAVFARVDARTQAPRNALLLVTAASVLGILLGRAAIVPIVNMAAICIAMNIVLMLAALLAERRRNPHSPGFSVPAAPLTIPLCLIGAGLMAGFALIQPLWLGHGFPLEWQLIAIWSVLGLGFYRLTRR